MNFPVINLKQTGSRIKKLCKEAGLSPNRLKKELNLSCVQTVYKWFQGENLPSIENFYALSLLLNVSMEELLVFKEVKPFVLEDKYKIIHIDKNPLMKSRIQAYYQRLSRIYS